MTPLDQLGTYQATSVLTASPGRLVFLLMDAAVRHLNTARNGFEIEDPADKFSTIGLHLGKTVEIVRELRRSLNKNEGGELAAHLEGLYQFLEDRIFDADIRKDVKMLDHCTTLLTGLRDSWRQMLQQQHSTLPSLPVLQTIDSSGFDVRT